MKKVVFALGILALVAGLVWLGRVYSTVTANARMSKLNQDVENLFIALQQYKENVGTYPMGSNAQISKALNGQNPKNIIILVGRKNAINEKGEFIDPWGTPLRIYFADNAVLVRSGGPNRRFDDSSVIDGDDYIRSN